MTVLLTDGSTTHSVDAWLLVHMMLALSSLQFRVERDGSRIHQGYITMESRAHTILFTARQVAVLTLQRFWPSRSPPPPGVCALVCLPFHLAVDAATARWGAAGFSSIRGSHEFEQYRQGPDAPDHLLHLAEVLARRILSYLQYLLNTAMLLAADRRAVAAFLLLWLLQLTPFLQTLRKKQLIGDKVVLYSYLVIIVLVTTATLKQLRPSARLHSLVIATAIFALRCRGTSKYCLWLMAVAAEAVLRGAPPLARCVAIAGEFCADLSLPVVQYGIRTLLI